jgi:predicted metal-dependent phosphoesterase TrpH
MKKIYKIDFHVHTNSSYDCSYTIDEMVKAAKIAKIDGFALTNHNTINGFKKASEIAKKENIIIIPGIEITSVEGVHLIALFISKMPKKRKILEIISEIKRMDGISILPHPYRTVSGLFYNLKNKKMINSILKTVDLIEIINHKSLLKKEKNAKDLVNKYRKKIVGGSDAHFPYEIGKCYTEIICSKIPIKHNDILKNSNKVFFYNLKQFVKPIRKKYSKTQNKTSNSVIIAKKILPESTIIKLNKFYLKSKLKKYNYEK